MLYFNFRDVVIGNENEGNVEMLGLFEVEESCSCFRVLESLSLCGRDNEMISLILCVLTCRKDY